MKNKHHKQIKEAVTDFMGEKRVVWATPSGGRYSSNFYGDESLCRLTKMQLVRTIECYVENYGDDHENVSCAIESIISDMQFDKPKWDSSGRLVN